MKARFAKIQLKDRARDNPDYSIVTNLETFYFVRLSIKSEFEDSYVQNQKLRGDASNKTKNNPGTN